MIGLRVKWTATIAGSSCAALAMALPWGASGRRWRSAYALLRLVRALDIAHGTMVGAFIACVTLAPILAAGVWVAMAMGWLHIARVLAGAVAVLTLMTAYAVFRSPLRPGAGVTLGVVAAVVTLVGIATLQKR